MSILFSYYNGVLNDALLSGVIIGAAVGIVVFGASEAAEGMHRVLFGFLLGGLVMGIFQSFLIMAATGISLGTSFTPLLDVGPTTFGQMVVSAVTYTIQAAFAGGLLMVISVAPIQSLKGALAGIVIGGVAALAAWWLLGQLNVAIPLVIFYILQLGVILFILDNLPRRSRT